MKKSKVKQGQGCESSSIRRAELDSVFLFNFFEKLVNLVLNTWYDSFRKKTYFYQ